MPLTKLKFLPGINRDRSNLASMGGWYDGDKIRFREGYPEKIGYYYRKRRFETSDDDKSSLLVDMCFFV